MVCHYPVKFANRDCGKLWRLFDCGSREICLVCHLIFQSYVIKESCNIYQ